MVSGRRIVCMQKKTAHKKKEGYSLEEVRQMTDRLIDESTERLRTRLRAAWAERAMKEK